MLNYFLGWTVGLGSLGFYLAGYLLPEVRRKKDAIWSGVGLIYALALLTNGDRISVGLLLGQLASTTLISWFGWQILQQRRDLSDAVSQTPIPNSVQSVFPFLKQGWERLLTAYTNPEDDDDRDLLASGIKKASTLLAGRSESADAIATPVRSKTEAAPIAPEAEEDWEDDQPSESSSHATTVNPSPETNTSMAESTEHSEPEHSEVTAAVESVEAIAPPEEVPVISPDIIEPVEHSDVTPSTEMETTVVDAAIPSEEQTAPQEQITPSTQEPDLQPDPAQPLASSSTGEEEDWPPRDATV